jgi:hypothetical protein
MKRLVGKLLVLLLLLGGTSLFAQEVAIAFFEDISGDFKIVSETGDEELYGDELSFGDPLPLGWTLVTGNGDSAELSMDPSGTIIKVAENTNFKVDTLQGVDDAPSNNFTLGFGKFRAVAGRVAGDEKYNFKGQSATCGVRGTDLGMQILQGVDSFIEEVFVFSGEIEYTLIETGESILVKAGEFASALADVLQPLEMDEVKRADLLDKLDFESLVPEEVQQVISAVEEVISEAVAEEEAAEEDLLAGMDEESFLYTFLTEILGFEIGSITIGDEIFGKAILTPTFSIGALTMSLYLPIIYRTNMLDPNDWYHPKGNDEWSFGTDEQYKGDILGIVGDILSDLALKIKFVQWGQQRDPFFFKVGNVSNFTIGHGLIMRDYANDSEFPAIRRIGVNLGMDFTTAGFETIINDLAEPEIFGGRLYIRPAAPTFPLAIGVSGIVDIDPAGDLPAGTAEEIGNPALINAGLDLDYPIVENDFMSLILFGDVAGMIPYYRANGTGTYTGITPGLAWETVVTDTPEFGIKNIGAASGVFGNIGPLDYRLEYRYYTGTFQPAIFDNAYDRTRGQYAVDTADYTLNPSDPQYEDLTMGIYGLAGYTWENVFSFAASYMWPFDLTDTGVVANDRDEFLMTAILERGVIPVVDFGASVTYAREFFIPTLLNKDPGLKTRVEYGAAKNIDVILIITTTLARNEDGSIIYVDSRPELATTMSIETNFHF